MSQSENINELYGKCETLGLGQEKLKGRVNTLEETTDLKMDAINGQMGTMNTTMENGFDNMKNGKRAVKEWLMGIAAVIVATIVINVGIKFLDRALNPKNEQIKTIIQEINKQNAKEPKTE